MIHCAKCGKPCTILPRGEAILSCTCPGPAAFRFGEMKGSTWNITGLETTIRKYARERIGESVDALLRSIPGVKP